MASQNKNLSCFRSNERQKLRRYKERQRRNENMAHKEPTTCRFRELCWLKHRQIVANVTPVVDCKPPKFPPFVFTKTCSFERKLAGFSRLEKENAIKAHRLAGVMLGRCGIDNELGPEAKTNYLNPGYRRIKDQVKIARDNQVFASRLLHTGAVYSRKEQLRWYKEQEDIMEFGSKFPLYWRERNCTDFEASAELKATSGVSLKVYFDFEVKDRETGRVVMELYPKVAPVAVENFRILCITTKSRGFRCFQIDRMWEGLFWTMGRGARGIASEFPPVKIKRIKHDKEGVVTLVNNGSNMVDAEFMITARELAPLNGRNLAIGYVTQGMKFLRSLVKYKRQHSHRFRIPIFITATGEIDPNGAPPPPLSKLKNAKEQTEEDEDDEDYEIEDNGSGEFEVEDN